MHDTPKDRIERKNKPVFGHHRKECLSWTLTSKLLEHVQVIRAFQVERNSHDHSRNKEWLRKGQGIVGKISWIKLQLNVIYLTSLIIFLHLLARQI